MREIQLNDLCNKQSRKIFIEQNKNNKISKLCSEITVEINTMKAKKKLTKSKKENMKILFDFLILLNEAKGLGKDKIDPGFLADLSIQLIEDGKLKQDFL